MRTALCHAGRNMRTALRAPRAQHAMASHLTNTEHTTLSTQRSSHACAHALTASPSVTISVCTVLFPRCTLAQFNIIVLTAQSSRPDAHAKCPCVDRRWHSPCRRTYAAAVPVRPGTSEVCSPGTAAPSSAFLSASQSFLSISFCAGVAGTAVAAVVPAAAALAALLDFFLSANILTKKKR